MLSTLKAKPSSPRLLQCFNSCFQGKRAHFSLSSHSWVCGSCDVRLGRLIHWWLWMLWGLFVVSVCGLHLSIGLRVDFCNLIVIDPSQQSPAVGHKDITSITEVSLRTVIVKPDQWGQHVTGRCRRTSDRSAVGVLLIVRCSDQDLIKPNEGLLLQSDNGTWQQSLSGKFSGLFLLYSLVEVFVGPHDPGHQRPHLITVAAHKETVETGWNVRTKLSAMLGPPAIMGNSNTWSWHHQIKKKHTWNRQNNTLHHI